MSELHLVKIIFKQHLSQRDLSRFRGVVIGLADNDQLTHNHDGSGFKYSYPKIQYKIINGHPAIIGIGEGGLLLKRIFTDKTSFSCHLGYREVLFEIGAVEDIYSEIALTDRLYSYHIDRWQPLNNRNLPEFNRCTGLLDRVVLLEKILTGNILSCAKGLGVFFRERIVCKIDSLDYDGNTAYKGVEMLNFSADFKTNVLLPQWIGLGKSASLNHGTITYKFNNYG